MRPGAKVPSRMGGLPALEISPRRIGQQHSKKDQQHENRCCRTAREQAALEHEVVDDQRGELGGDSGTSAGKRPDEIEGGDGELQLDYDHSHCDRPKRGKNDAPVHAYRPGAIDLCGLDEIGVDRAETGKEERHGEARGLPDRGDDNGPDRHIAVDQPVEPEGGPAKPVDELLNADAGVEQPAPDRAGDDKGNGHRVEEDRPQHVLTADALVEQDREEEAGQQAQKHETTAKHQQIVEGDLPIPRCHHRGVVAHARPARDRNEGGRRERYPDGPQRERNEMACRQQQRYPDRQKFRQAAQCAERRRRARSRCRRHGLAQRAPSTASLRRATACSGVIDLFFTYSVSTSIIAAVIPFSCAMLCARLSTAWLAATASLSAAAVRRCPSDQPPAERSTSVRTGIDPVICEYMVWIAGSMTSWAINVCPACRSGSLRCQNMKASAFNKKTGVPLSEGPGAMTKSPSLKPALSNTPCAQPPWIIMPMSPATKRCRLME